MDSSIYSCQNSSWDGRIVTHWCKKHKDKSRIIREPVSYFYCWEVWYKKEHTECEVSQLEHLQNLWKYFTKTKAIIEEGFKLAKQLYYPSFKESLNLHLNDFKVVLDNIQNRINTNTSKGNFEVVNRIIAEIQALNSNIIDCLMFKETFILLLEDKIQLNINPIQLEQKDIEVKIIQKEESKSL